MKKKKRGHKRTVPLCVKVISSLYFFAAFILFFVSVFALLRMSFFDSSSNDFLILFSNNPFSFYLFVFFLMVIGFLGFLIGRGLWMGDERARVIAFLFSLISAIGYLFSMFSGDIKNNFFPLVFNLLIFWYLGFDKEVKKSFK